MSKNQVILNSNSEGLNVIYCQNRNGGKGEREMLETNVVKVRRLCSGLPIFKKYRSNLVRGWYKSNSGIITEAVFVFGFGIPFYTVVHCRFDKNEYNLRFGDREVNFVYVGTYTELRLRNLLKFLSEMGGLK